MVGTFGQMAAPPSFGYDNGDMAQYRAQGAPSVGASLVASAGVGDLANARVVVDTAAPLRGFLLGIAVLTAIRVLWETLPE